MNQRVCVCVGLFLHACFEVLLKEGRALAPPSRLCFQLANVMSGKNCRHHAVCN